MSGIWTLLAAVIAFGVTALLGKWMVPFLHKLNFGQTIREEGPKWHQKKQGTPTMGGLMFIVGITLAVAICVPAFYANVQEETFLLKVRVFAGLGMALGYGAVGFIDDYIKVVKKRNLGLTALQKLILQFIVAGAYLGVLASSGGDSATMIPFVGAVDLGWFYWPLCAVVIVGVVNAVNLTDGIDGLASCVTFVCMLGFMFISSWLGNTTVALFAAAVAGGCAGFLSWNFYPARCFMGDTGSMFLGGAVVAAAYGLGRPELLLFFGVIYLAEAFSVMLQVTYFKLTHGKRIFKMSPIHHHFEMSGWSEVQIDFVFSLGTLTFVLLGCMYVYLS